MACSEMRLHRRSTSSISRWIDGVLEDEAQRLVVTTDSPTEDAMDADDVQVVRRRGGHAVVDLGLTKRGPATPLS